MYQMLCFFLVILALNDLNPTPTHTSITIIKTRIGYKMSSDFLIWKNTVKVIEQSPSNLPINSANITLFSVAAR
jgi:hypothetical protein